VFKTQENEVCHTPLGSLQCSPNSLGYREGRLPTLQEDSVTLHRMTLNQGDSYLQQKLTGCHFIWRHFIGWACPAP